MVKVILLWVILSGLALFFILFYFPIFWGIHKSGIELERKYCQLIVRTNHKDMLDTCRNLIKQYPDSEWRLIDNKYAFFLSKQKKAEEIPNIIKELEPIAVYIHSEMLYISLADNRECNGGIIVCMDDGNETETSFRIIPGLFYKDDRAYGNKEEFKKYLDNLVEKERKNLSKEGINK